MKIELNVNGQPLEHEGAAGETLLSAIRSEGYYSAKHGCETGECGACTVLIDGVPVNSCVHLAAQAQGHKIETTEAIGARPELGWKTTAGLHPLQQAFAESGAIQCGYCTPAMLLASKHLLERNLNPTEAEVREVLSGVLCRCTGYLKPVQSVLHAAAVMRGEAEPGDMFTPSELDKFFIPHPPAGDTAPSSEAGASTVVRVLPKVLIAPQTETWKSVGRPEVKVDAIKLVQGKPAFAADFERRGLLYAKVLKSPHAHARIKSINADKARQLPGVAAVLTHKDIPRVVYSTAGQSDPIPGPLDMFSLDTKVRFVGDRVAFVAAETPELAEKALELIEVEYEVLPSILDSRQAMESRTQLHDEPEYVNFEELGPGPQSGRPHPHRYRRRRKRLRRSRPDLRIRICRPQGAADLHRAACGRYLLGRGRPPGHPHQHPGSLPCAASDGARAWTAH